MSDRPLERRRPQPQVPVNIHGPHFVIAPFGSAWRIVVHHLHAASEFIPASTLAEAVRLARPFADAGMVGFILESEPWVIPFAPTSPVPIGAPPAA